MRATDVEFRSVHHAAHGRDHRFGDAAVLDAGPGAETVLKCSGTLDLDIILFGDRSFSDSHLVIPHPQFSRRLFVLEPMFEIGGDRFIPGYGSLRYLIDNAPAISLEKLI